MSFDFKFIKFLFVGALNTLFGYLIFSAFIFLGIHYVLAGLLATVAGIIFNFFTTGRLVFKNKNNTLFLKFLLVYGFMWVLNSFVLFVFESFNYTNMYLNAAIILLPSSIISFLLFKYFVFLKKDV